VAPAAATVVRVVLVVGVLSGVVTVVVVVVESVVLGELALVRWWTVVVPWTVPLADGGDSAVVGSPWLAFADAPIPMKRVIASTATEAKRTKAGRTLLVASEPSVFVNTAIFPEPGSEWRRAHGSALSATG
jgi:hypothetical protein